ncbi:NAD(P)/FAD-dependent oxidoreductase, partial [candidate division KSB1 bacterium]
IEGYYFETLEGSTYFPKPSDSRINSVYRANGSFISSELYNISFDSFVLQKSIEMGAEKIEKNIADIEFPLNPEDKVKLFTDNRKESYEFDLVINASGVNTTFVKKLEEKGIGYKAPECLYSCQAEIPFEPGMDLKLRENVILFLLHLKDIYFFTFTPKAQFTTVTVVGPHIKAKMMEGIFDHPNVLKYFPEGWKVPLKYCHCHPKIPVSTAKNPFYDRFVVIGDACWSRYLKDGITSAFYTSKYAVDSIFRNGITKSAFKNGYYKRIIREDYDNKTGKILFWFHSKLRDSKAYRESVFFMAASTKYQKVKENTKLILWGFFTGDYPYKKILKLCLKSSFILFLIGKIILTKTGYIYIKILDLFRKKREIMK